MMSEEKHNETLQQQSADEFFKTEAPQQSPPQDLGDIVKDQLKHSAQYAGKQMAYSFLLSFLPISGWRKRELSNRMANGEKISLRDILFGRITIGRLIGWVIAGAILIFLVIQLSNSGVLNMLR